MQVMARRLVRLVADWLAGWLADRQSKSKQIKAIHRKAKQKQKKMQKQKQR
jgi:hypothetical protein